MARSARLTERRTVTQQTILPTTSRASWHWTNACPGGASCRFALGLQSSCRSSGSCLRPNVSVSASSEASQAHDRACTLGVLPAMLATCLLHFEHSASSR